MPEKKETLSNIHDSIDSTQEKIKQSEASRKKEVNEVIFKWVDELQDQISSIPLSSWKKFWKNSQLLKSSLKSVNQTLRDLLREEEKKWNIDYSSIVYAIENEIREVSELTAPLSEEEWLYHIENSFRPMNKHRMWETLDGAKDSLSQEEYYRSFYSKVSQNYEENDIWYVLDWYYDSNIDQHGFHMISKFLFYQPLFFWKEKSKEWEIKSLNDVLNTIRSWNLTLRKLNEVEQSLKSMKERIGKFDAFMLSYNFIEDSFPWHWLWPKERVYPDYMQTIRDNYFDGARESLIKNIFTACILKNMWVVQIEIAKRELQNAHNEFAKNQDRKQFTQKLLEWKNLVSSAIINLEDANNLFSFNPNFQTNT